MAAFVRLIFTTLPVKSQKIANQLHGLGVVVVVFVGKGFHEERMDWFCSAKLVFHLRSASTSFSCCAEVGEKQEEVRKKMKEIRDK